LVLIGFGGSLPAYDENKQKRWKGYPYKSEEEFEKEFSVVEEKIKILVQKKKSIILVTHVGPSSSSTTIYHKNINESKIYSGSETLSKFLKEDISQQNIFLNLHGHTHLGDGKQNICKVQVINPGSLS
jgi:Icc-related predicted phosphoesterase